MSYFYYRGEDMNITNFPAKSSLQVMESVAWGDNQQVATGTKSAPSLNETAGVPEGPAPGEANTAGECCLPLYNPPRPPDGPGKLSI
ncbi:hypothetical protein, partial [Pseudomonas gessardii]|uniref:hypothetical protein n=1 Tax=Pseudomonas gessardii TaxID=78544 RepID=UPI001F2DCADA